MSSNPLMISPVVDDTVKGQETKQPEVFPKKSLVEEKESDMKSHQNDGEIQTGYLQTEKEKVDKLQKLMAEPNFVISDSNPKIKTAEEELIASKKLYMELEEKYNAVFDLEKNLDALMLKKDAIDATIEALGTEKCSRASLIRQELVNLKKDFQSFIDEISKVRHDSQQNRSNIITPNADVEMERLKKQLADFKVIISYHCRRVKSTEEELWASKNVIASLQKVIDDQRETIHGMLERVTDVVFERDDRIKELKKEVADLNKSLNALKLEKKI